MENQQEEEMRIKIQTFDNNFPLKIPRTSTVLDLKNKITESTNIPNDKQRLIFQGKLLQPNDVLLSNYKIGDDSVIHLVAKTIDQPSSEQNSSTNQNQAQDGNRGLNLEDIYSGVLEIPVLRSTRRSRRRRIPQFDISESFESLHQNLLSLKNLERCIAKFNNEEIAKSKVIAGFDLNKTTYEVGQWVDVKDTIDQWLEAQVVQVRGTQAFIHYNGWGNRWDEWIDFSSPRIAPFKTYTVQSPNSVFLSPYPTVVPDANVESQKRSIEIFYYLEKSSEYMANLMKGIEGISVLRNSSKQFETKIEGQISEEEKEKLIKENELRSFRKLEAQEYQLNNSDHEMLFMCSQLIPLMDRTGRLLSDISLHLSHLLLNNNLYPQMFLGYNIGTNVPSGEQRVGGAGNQQQNQNTSNINNQANRQQQVNPQSNNNSENQQGQQQFDLFNFLNSRSQNLAQMNQQTTQQTTQQPNTSRITVQANLGSSFNLTGLSSLFSQLFQQQNLGTDPRQQIQTNTTNNQTGNRTAQPSGGTSEVTETIRQSSSQPDRKDSSVSKEESNDNRKLSADTLQVEKIQRKVSVSGEDKQKFNLKLFRDSLPKINLQVPAILSLGEINSAGASNEQNVDILVHTFISPGIVRNSNSNSSASAGNSQSGSNTGSNNQNSNSNEGSANGTLNAETLLTSLLLNQNPTQQNANQGNVSIAGLLENMTNLLTNGVRTNNASYSNSASQPSIVQNNIQANTGQTVNLSGSSTENQTNSQTTIQQNSQSSITNSGNNAQVNQQSVQESQSSNSNEAQGTNSLVQKANEEDDIVIEKNDLKDKHNTDKDI